MQHLLDSIKAPTCKIMTIAQNSSIDKAVIKIIMQANVSTREMASFWVQQHSETSCRQVRVGLLAHILIQEK